MSLPNDICRCLGLLPAPDGVQRCAKRDECARYMERHNGGERTPCAQWLCPTTDDYYGMFIPRAAQQ